MARAQALVVTALAVALLGGMFNASARGASVTVSLVNPGPMQVTPGTPFTLEVRATFDTRLSGIAFRLSAAGAPGALLTARSLNPTGPNGLTYVSRTSQNPFQANLPHDLKSAAVREVAYDNDFGGLPGSAGDGLAPGAGVLIEEITIVPSGTGVLTIVLSEVSAVHTTQAPHGKLFEHAAIGTGQVQVFVGAGLFGDLNGDGVVNFVDFTALTGCLNGPLVGFPPPGCSPLNFSLADLEGDGDVDMSDFALFQAVFGTTR